MNIHDLLFAELAGLDDLVITMAGQQYNVHSQVLERWCLSIDVPIIDAYSELVIPILYQQGIGRRTSHQIIKAQLILDQLGYTGNIKCRHLNWTEFSKWEDEYDPITINNAFRACRGLSVYQIGSHPYLKQSDNGRYVFIDDHLMDMQDYRTDWPKLPNLYHVNDDGNYTVNHGRMYSNYVKNGDLIKESHLFDNSPNNRTVLGVHDGVTYTRSNDSPHYFRSDQTAIIIADLPSISWYKSSIGNTFGCFINNSQLYYFDYVKDVHCMIEAAGYVDALLAVRGHNVIIYRNHGIYQIDITDLFNPQITLISTFSGSVHHILVGQEFTAYKTYDKQFLLSKFRIPTNHLCKLNKTIQEMLDDLIEGHELVLARFFTQSKMNLFLTKMKELCKLFSKWNVPYIPQLNVDTRTVLVNTYKYNQADASNTKFIQLLASEASKSHGYRNYKKFSVVFNHGKYALTNREVLSVSDNGYYLQYFDDNIVIYDMDMVPVHSIYLLDEFQSMRLSSDGQKVIINQFLSHRIIDVESGKVEFNKVSSYIDPSMTWYVKNSQRYDLLTDKLIDDRTIPHPIVCSSDDYIITMTTGLIMTIYGPTKTEQFMLPGNNVDDITIQGTKLLYTMDHIPYQRDLITSKTMKIC